jgi:cell division protein FtsI/penicillin-binding protein 2
MDPNNGEILAIASYPRFNPNDFINSSITKKEKNKKVNEWLETQQHIANIWDGKNCLKKELFTYKKGFYDEFKPLSFDRFLNSILPENSPIITMLNNFTIKNGVTLQEDVRNILFHAKQTDANILFNFLFDNNHLDTSLKEEIANNLNKNDPLSQKRILSCLSPITNNKDKLLLVDLCLLFVNSYNFSDELLNKVGHISLKDYWDFSKATLKLKDLAQTILLPIFQDTCFNEWKQLHQKEFLKIKREEEKQGKKSFHPYVDYLDDMQKKMFKEFWQDNCFTLLSCFLNPSFEDKIDAKQLIYLNTLKNKINLPNDTLSLLKTITKNLPLELTTEFLKTVRSFNELDRPLFGHYPSLKKQNAISLEKHLASTFYPKNGYGYCHSYAYQQASALGSIFKIITSYAVLKERYDNNEMPLSPLTIIDNFTITNKDFIVGYNTNMHPYYRMYKGGRLPKSAQAGMGKIDLLGALEQSSNPYFAILAGDFLSDPQKLISAAKNFGFGEKTNIDLPRETTGHLPNDITSSKTALYSLAIGQHSFTATPIQTAVMLSALVNGGKILRPSIVQNNNATIKREIDIPLPIKAKIMRGLKGVVWGEKGSARADIIRKLKNNPSLKEKYLSLQGQFVGKTSTAEFKYNPFILPSSSATTYKNIWFGAISFDLKMKKPELVVVVYLQFGISGKEAAPLAAQIIEKYRQITSNNHKQLHPYLK